MQIRPAKQSPKRYKSILMLTLLSLGALLPAGTLMAQTSATSATAQETITPLITKDLAGVPGEQVLMYTVDFPPGFSSPIHRHNAQVSVYVLEGSVVMQVRGGKELTLGPGESFYEAPNDIHVVSRNASTTKPARFLVFLINRKGAPLVIPAK
ncbi:MAG TPA: cupin domain-containing protein [Acidobacteriaceae bacterium]